MEKALEFDLKSRYASDLEGALSRDFDRIARHQTQLDKRPLMIPVKINLQMVRSQAQEARAIIQAELNSGGGPQILGANGLPAQTTQNIKAIAGNIASTLKTTFDATGNKIKSQVREQVEQIGEGLKKITRFKIDPGSGKVTRTSETQRETLALAGYNAKMKELIQLQNDYANAKARGDLKGQRSFLNAQVDRLDNKDNGFLSMGAQQGLVGTPEYRRAERKLERLKERLATLDGKEETTTARAKKAQASRDFERIDKHQDRKVQAELKENLAAQSRAKLITDEVAKEKELNRLLDERRKILTDNQRFYQRLDAAASRRNLPNLADRAMRRTLGAANDVNQFDLDRTRAGTKQTLDEREAAKKQAERIAKEQAAQAKKAAAEARQKQESSLRFQIQDIQKQAAIRLAEIKAEEAEKLGNTQSNRAKRGISGRADRQRQELLQDSQRKLLGIEASGKANGMDQVEMRARGAREDFQKKAIDLQAKHESIARRSGHATDFHTGSLLKNAATFARWNMAAQMVLHTITAIKTGFGDMMKVDRQFATLRAVFRGTEEDAKKLRDGTMALAVAEGRSADEAMDASIRFSRLGMTRVQVLKATSTALVAANVAEMTAAETAEKFSAIMTVYKLTVDDLPEVLNRINAISNRYNVTNKDLLEGIARVAGTAREAGIELKNLEGIIGAVTGATGRSGSETGNALRTIIQKIAQPETVEQLKTMFDFDVTDGTGNLKDMYTILKDMSELFPKLTNFQRAQLTELVAGSRQGDRFAKIMGQMSTAQYLTAQAANDTNSAWNENQKILNSLESQVNSLKSAWTELWVTLGDVGAINFVNDLLGNLREVVLELDELIARRSKSPDSTGKIRVDDLQKRKQIAAGIAENGAVNLSPDREISESQIRGSIANYEGLLEVRSLARQKKKSGKLTPEQTKRLAEIRKDLTERGGISDWVVDHNFDFSSGDNAFFGEGFGNSPSGTPMSGMVDAQMKEAVNTMKELLSGKITKDSTTETSRNRSRLTFLTEGREGFESLARRVSSGDYDRDAVAKDFEQLVRLVPQLKGGGAEYARSKSLIQAGLKDGTAGPELMRLAGLFGAEEPGAEKEFRTSQKTEMEIHQNAIANLTSKRDALQQQMVTGDQSVAAIRAQEQAIQDLNDQIQNETDSLQSVEQAFKRIEQQALSMNAGLALDKFMTRSLRQAEATAGKIQSGVGGFGDQPLDRSLMLERTQISAPEDRLARQLSIEQAKLKASPGDKAQQEIVDRMDFRLRQLRKANQDRYDELDDQQIGKEIEYGMKESGRRAAYSAEGALVGRNRSEQMINQSRFTLGRLQTSQSELKTANGLATPAETAAELGKMLQDEATTRQNLLSLEQRQFQIGAERKNLENQLAEAQEKQTREAGKRLAMASREDQLRAAALSRTIRDSGKISGNEFQFLSTESRQAMVNYLPNEAPGNLDPSKEAFRESMRELQKEESAITDSMGNLRSEFDRLSASLTEGMKPGGVFNPTPQVINSASQVSSGVNQPEMRLNIQAIEVSIGIANELRTITEAAVRGQVLPEIQRLETWMRAMMPAPLTNGTNSATGN